MNQQTDKPKTKKTLIIVATYEELAPTFIHFGWQKANFIEQQNFDILITGVGIAATAFALGKHVDDRYNLLLNLGIAGSFDRDLALGTLVNITNDTFSELGAEDGEHFITIDELGFGKGTYSTSFTSAIKLISELPMVKGITVNTIHGNTKQIAQIQERLNVKTESMEGAAVFFAAEQLNIPVLQVRCISNYIEQRHKDQWKIGLAIKNLNEWFINYLNI